MLRPCPLCGGEVITIETHPGCGEIYCGNCDLVLGGDNAMTPDELIEKWNRRAKAKQGEVACMRCPMTFSDPCQDRIEECRRDCAWLVEVDPETRNEKFRKRYACAVAGKKAANFAVGEWEKFGWAR